MNNLHIIKFIQIRQQTKLRIAPVAFVLSSASSSLCRVCRAVLFDKLDTAKMHGLDTSNVSCRVVSKGAKWNLGYTVLEESQASHQ